MYVLFVLELRGYVSMVVVIVYVMDDSEIIAVQMMMRMTMLMTVCLWATNG